MDLTRAGYDKIATAYAERFLGELAHKPLDRALLDVVAVQAAGLGPVADVGCGPGHVARYLHERGAAALGIDLSPEMVRVAAETHPGIEFRVGDMRSLPLADGTLGGIVAFYSIIHLVPAELPAVAGEFYRALRPGGTVLASFHVGEERRHIEDFLGHAVSLDFQFYPRAAVEEAFERAGFAMDAFVERRPYEAEVATARGYLLAHRPADR